MRPSRRAFTLIEMLVVIGVIVLLAGLTLTIGTAVSARAARHETESTLALLDMATQEWQVHADRHLSWYDEHYHGAIGAPRESFDVHGDTPEEFIITEMLDVIGRAEPVREILGSMRPQFLYTYQQGTYPGWVGDDPELQSALAQFTGSLTVLDGWGWPIYATHPGRLWVDGYDDVYGYYAHDADGTIETLNERRYGAVRNLRVCFVSAGADGRFGRVSSPSDSPEFTETTDNVFSYDPFVPQLDGEDYGGGG